MRQVSMQREILATIKSRKASYVGHILGSDKYTIPRLIITGRIDEGRKSAGNNTHGSET